MFLRFALAFVFLAGSVHAQGPPLPAGTRFIMSHFVERPETGQDDRLYISYSADGVMWATLNGGAPVYQPENWASFYNVVRDPAIIYEGGWFWVAYTSGNYGRHQSFGLTKSQDLLHWTFVGEISAVRPSATDQLTWNPVWFRDGDGSVHLFISLSLTGGSSYYPVPDMQVHEMHPLNGDFTQWSAPALIGLQTTNTNELWVWKEGAVYHALYVLVPGGVQIHATSNDLLTGWSAPQYLGYQHQEGGMMLPRPEGGYRMLLESGYSGLPVGYRIYDLDANFASLGDGQLVSSSVGMRNGKITAAPATTHFADWQAQHLADLPAEQRTLTADPDGDGRSNLLEYATGLDPRAPDDLLPPRGFSLGDDANRYLAQAYRRLPSLIDVNYSVETAGASLVFAPAETAFAPRAITLLSDGTELVEAVDTTPMSSGGPRFVRLKVTLTAP